MEDPSRPGEMSRRAFQRLYLDEQMHHSSGWFDNPAVSLHAAQVRKSQRLTTLLELEPGMTVLDVGCSWGALARWMADRGADVTGITLEPEHATSTPRTPGLNIAVQRWQDYSGLVDRVTCINALENFDERPRFFRSLRSWLRPGGRGVIWSVTAESTVYRVPSVSNILEWSKDAGLEVLWATTGLAHHYARTLEHFVSNLETASIPAEHRITEEIRDRRLRFYDMSRRLLETGRNDMVEICFQRRS